MMFAGGGNDLEMKLHDEEVGVVAMTIVCGAVDVVVVMVVVVRLSRLSVSWIDTRDGAQTKMATCSNSLGNAIESQHGQ